MTYPATYQATYGGGGQQTTETLTGSSVWTCPAQVTSVLVEGTGGSASGGGSGAATGWDAGGGGAGEYAADTITTTPGQGYAYSVGAGGTSASNARGHDGGDTTFGTGPLLTAHGGKGGTTSQAGNALGGAGGTGSTAATHFPGGAGGNGTVNSSGGGGGGAATAAGAGVSGSGAAAGTGGGGGGTAAHPAGFAGTAGGGGGAYSSTAAAQASGPGTPGTLTLTYTVPVAGGGGGPSPSLEAGTSGAGTSGAGSAIGAPYTVLASAAVITTGTTYTATVTTPTANGDAITVNAATNITTITAVSDSKGNTYTLTTSNPTGTQKTAQFVALNTAPLVAGATPDTITITFGAVTASAQVGMIARACPGILITAATDTAGTASANGTSAAPAITGTTTLAQASEWVTALLADGNAAGAPTAWSGGFTQAGSSLHSSGQPYLTLAGLLTSSTAAPAASATLPASGVWGMSQTALKGASLGSASQNFTVPSGAASNDQILIWLAAGVSGVTWTAPGFTATPAASGTGGSCQLLSRRMDGTEGWSPGTSAVTVTGTGSQPWAGIICAVTGADTASPFDPAPSSSGQVNAASTTVTVPGVTTAADGDLLLWFGFSAGGSSTPYGSGTYGSGTYGSAATPPISLPPGFSPAGSQVSSTGSGTFANAGVVLGTALQPAHGATGNENGSLPAAAVNGGLVLALQRSLVAGGGPALRTGSAAFTTGVSALTLGVTVPSAAVPGNLILIYCAMAANNNSWTAPGFSSVSPAGGTNGSGQLLYRRMDGTEGWTPGTSKITVTSNQTQPWDAVICAVSNQDTGKPFDPAPAASGQVNAASTTLAVAGFSTVSDSDLLLWFGFADGTPAAGTAPATITVPAGYTAPAGVSQANSTGTGTVTNVGLTMATATQATHGVVAAANGTLSASQPNGGMLIAIRAPAAAPVTQSALAGALLDPALYGGDQAASVDGFDSTVGRVIGIRASSYPQGVIPASASDDGAAAPPPGPNTVTVVNPAAQTSTAGSADSLQLSATDSDPSQTVTWKATGLPAGLTLNTATGLISGTPATAGSSTVTATATDTTGASGSAVFTWSVTAATANTVTVTNPGNQTATVGVAKTVSMTGTDTAAGQTLTWTATGLPGGMAINPASGVISGTPTTAQTTSCTVTATDTTGAKGSASFGWTVSAPAANVVTVTNPGPQTSTTGIADSLQLHATDTAAGQTFTWTAAGLPAGLTIGAGTGLISGTPATAATSTVTATATDTTGAKGTASFAWTVSVPSTTAAVYGGGYATSDNGAANPLATDPVYTTWQNVMGRTFRMRGAFQGGSFPTTWGNLFWSGDKNIPRQTFVDVEPATDGSQTTAFENFLIMVKNNNADVIFRMYHSAHAKFGSATAFKSAYAFYGPLIKKHGFKLYLSFTTYDVNHQGVNTTWIPPNIAFDAMVYEWYHFNYFANNERLDAPAAIADSMGVAFGFSEIGCNFLAASSPDGPPATEAQGDTFFQYSRDFVANRIKLGKPWVFAAHWNQASGAGRATPGYEVINQPASWITWQRRIYDLHTKSTPGNPFIS